MCEMIEVRDDHRDGVASAQEVHQGIDPAHWLAAIRRDVAHAPIFDAMILPLRP